MDFGTIYNNRRKCRKHLNPKFETPPNWYTELLCWKELTGSQITSNTQLYVDNNTVNIHFIKVHLYPPMES